MYYIYTYVSLSVSLGSIYIYRVLDTSILLITYYTSIKGGTLDYSRQLQLLTLWSNRALRRRRAGSPVWMRYRSRRTATWVWVNIHIIFSGMNIHLPAILGFTRHQRFDPSPHLNGQLIFIDFFSMLQPYHVLRGSKKDRAASKLMASDGTQEASPTEISNAFGSW